jgi:hypothetical protein
MEPTSELCEVCNKFDFHTTFGMSNVDRYTNKYNNAFWRVQENIHCAFCPMVAHVASSEGVEYRYSPSEINEGHVKCSTMGSGVGSFNDPDGKRREVC